MSILFEQVFKRCKIAVGAIIIILIVIMIIMIITIIMITTISAIFNDNDNCNGNDTICCLGSKKRFAGVTAPTVILKYTVFIPPPDSRYKAPVTEIPVN